LPHPPSHGLPIEIELPRDLANPHAGRAQSAQLLPSLSLDHPVLPA
jgi:hypothetical protein